MNLRELGARNTLSRRIIHVLEAQKGRSQVWRSQVRPQFGHSTANLGGLHFGHCSVKPTSLRWGLNTDRVTGTPVTTRPSLRPLTSPQGQRKDRECGCTENHHQEAKAEARNQAHFPSPFFVSDRVFAPPVTQRLRSTFESHGLIHAPLNVRKQDHDTAPGFGEGRSSDSLPPPVFRYVILLTCQTAMPVSTIDGNIRKLPTSSLTKE